MILKKRQMCNFMRSLSVCKGAIVLFVIALSVVLLFTATVSAEECFTATLGDDKKDLEKALEKCQEEIEKTEKVLQKQQATRTNTEYDILLIDHEINKALLRIRSSDIAIGQLGDEIVSKEGTVSHLSEKIKEHQYSLGELLQRINESERKGFLNLLLSDATISAFFSRISEYESLRETMEDSIRDINNLKVRLTANVDELQEKKTQQTQVRHLRRASANQVQDRKSRKETILRHLKNLEKKTQEQISQYETRAGQIRNRLFELRGGGAIPFERALVIAEEVEKRTGVRPAFLLGLIKHESDLGKNVGTGTYLTDMHPTRDQPIFPYIAKLLGYDPDDLQVSANPGFGWGGAMGPAQFIPSTWVCYGGLVNIKTDTCSLRGQLIKTTEVMRTGSRGADVKRLQKFLNQNGFTITRSGAGSPGKETTVYTDDVARAVSRFQEKYAGRILRPYGYTRGTGQVGPSTRAAINQLNFYSGPWQYRADKDTVRKYTKNDAPSNPWNPRDAFFASGIYLKEIGAAKDECVASRKYYAGGNWRSQVALNYCRAVLSNARLFQRDIDYLKS